jgi:hypothetical protein
MILQQLERDFGWTGVRAPDLVYGDEENLLEGIILCMASMLLWQGNPLTWMFATIMCFMNLAIGILGIARVLDVWTLIPQVAFIWSGVWTFVCIVASWEWLQANFKLQRKRSLS